MKKLFLIILAFLLLTVRIIACTGSPNGITEVGNPNPQQEQQKEEIARIDGTISTISHSIGGFLNIFAEQNSATSNLTCTYDENTQSSSCDCAGGGTIVYVFTSDYVENGNLVSFNSIFTTTLNDCVVSSCDNSVTLHGEYTGSMSGSFDSANNTGEITVTFNTASACSGLNIDSNSIGFDMTATQESTESNDFTGSICINDETTTFTSLADLSQQIDPNTTCSNLFN